MYKYIVHAYTSNSRPVKGHLEPKQLIYVHIYICIYVYVYICIHIYIYIYINNSMRFPNVFRQPLSESSPWSECPSSFRADFRASSLGARSTHPSSIYACMYIYIYICVSIYIYIYIYIRSSALADLRRLDPHGQFPQLRFAKFKIEGLDSQNHRLLSLQHTLWRFESPRGWAHFSIRNF